MKLSYMYMTYIIQFMLSNLGELIYIVYTTNAKMVYN